MKRKVFNLFKHQASPSRALTRSATFDRSTVNIDNRTARVSFASETRDVGRAVNITGDQIETLPAGHPDAKGWPIIPEVLSHSEKGHDHSFLRTGASVLRNHDPNQIIGSIEDVQIVEGRSEATVKFSSSDDGNNAWEDVKSGALRSTSVGYDHLPGTVYIPAGEVHQPEWSERAHEGPCLLCRWKANEITLTPLPADSSVGVGRSLTTGLQKEGKKMKLVRVMTLCLRRGLNEDAAKKIHGMCDEGTTDVEVGELIDAFAKQRKAAKPRILARAAVTNEADDDERGSDSEALRAEADEAEQRGDMDEAQALRDEAEAAEKETMAQGFDVEANPTYPLRGRGTSTRRGGVFFSARDVAKQERIRCEGIRLRCAEAGLDEEFTKALIDSGEKLERACMKILDAQRSNAGEAIASGQQRGGAKSGVEVGAEKAQKVMEFIERGIMERMNPSMKNLRLGNDTRETRGMEQKARSFAKRSDGKWDEVETVTSYRGEDVEPEQDWDLRYDQLKAHRGADRTLSEYCRMALEATGYKDASGKTAQRMDKFEVCENVFMARMQRNSIAAANTTGDLPGLLANILNKQLLRLWKRADPTWRYWCSVGSLTDYKPAYRIIMSDTGELLPLNENAEILDSKISDGFEPIQLADYGRGISLSHQMFVNDDIGGLTTLSARMTQATLRLPSRLIYTKLLSNPTLNKDGLAVFEANTHKNLSTGGGSALTIAGLQQAIAKFRLQTSFQAPGEPVGNNAPTNLSAEPLDIEPNIILCGPTNEKAAFDLVNPNMFLTNALFFKNRFTVVVEPRLETFSGGTTTKWWLAAGPENVQTAEVAFRNGSDRPMMRQFEARDRLAITMQTVLPCATNFNDYRGMSQNNGV